MDILNFISWIRGKRQVTSVDPNKTLIPVGLKDGRRDDDYLAGAISVADLAAQLGTNTQQALTDSVYLNGFINTGCIGVDITLPENATFEYNSPLSMCVGSTLTIPPSTTLTII
jgi:hypothetical protein